jgi:hypothetical protein
LPGGLLKPKKAPLSVIEIRGAIRVGAFQIHRILRCRLSFRLKRHMQGAQQRAQ